MVDDSSSVICTVIFIYYYFEFEKNKFLDNYSSLLFSLCYFKKTIIEVNPNNLRLWRYLATGSLQGFLEEKKKDKYKTKITLLIDKLKQP